MGSFSTLAPVRAPVVSTDYLDELYAQPGLTTDYYDFRIAYDANYMLAGQERTYLSKTITVPPNSTVVATLICFTAGPTGTVQLRLYIGGVIAAYKNVAAGTYDSHELIGMRSGLSGSVAIEFRAYAVDGGAKRVSYRGYIGICIIS